MEATGPIATAAARPASSSARRRSQSQRRWPSGSVIGACAARGGRWRRPPGEPPGRCGPGPDRRGAEVHGDDDRHDRGSAPVRARAMRWVPGSWWTPWCTNGIGLVTSSEVGVDRDLDEPRRAHHRAAGPLEVAELGLDAAAANPGSAGSTPRTADIRSRVGVDDQPWLTVPPYQVSVQDVGQRSSAHRQSRHWAGMRSARPGRRQRVVHDVAEERLGPHDLRLDVPPRVGWPARRSRRRRGSRRRSASASRSRIAEGGVDAGRPRR